LAIPSYQKLGKKVSSQEVYQKIMQEYHNRENCLHKWFLALMATAITANSVIKNS
jgi:hypothetical protein